MVNYPASAACDECSCPRYHKSVDMQPALKDLHWLPVEQRITCKLCPLMHLIHMQQAPQYLIDCLSTVSAASSRYRLRGWDQLILQTMFCQGQELHLVNIVSAILVQLSGNSLPSDLHDLTDTKTFTEQLKSVLFKRTYSWLFYGAPGRFVKRRPTDLTLYKCKKLQFIHTVNGDGSKTAKIIKIQFIFV